jgi:hypothetical protein
MKDPIRYATDSVMKSLDTVGEIEGEINKLKLLIQVYFSDEVQRDETPMGAMRRNQIRKELLDFASR